MPPSYELAARGRGDPDEDHFLVLIIRGVKGFNWVRSDRTAQPTGQGLSKQLGVDGGLWPQ
ncbi:MAG: hypothetical protein ACKPKO_21015, partial [Candidatus Fonsibacter sp.]